MVANRGLTQIECSAFVLLFMIRPRLAVLKHNDNIFAFKLQNHSAIQKFIYRLVQLKNTPDVPQYCMRMPKCLLILIKHIYHIWVWMHQVEMVASTDTYPSFVDRKMTLKKRKNIINLMQRKIKTHTRTVKKNKKKNWNLVIDF